MFRAFPFCLIFATLCFGYNDDRNHNESSSSYSIVVPNSSLPEDFEMDHSMHMARYGKNSRPDPAQWKGHDLEDLSNGDKMHLHPQESEPTPVAHLENKYSKKDPLEKRVQKYGYPPNCVKQDEKKDIPIEKTYCDYMLIINLYPNKFGTDGYAHFKMSRKMPKPFGYFAVGLSQDDQMNDDHIVECVKPGNVARPSIYHSWSNFHSRPTRLPENSAIIKNKNETFDSKTSILICEFDRPLITTIFYVKGDSELKSQVFDMTKEKYTILMAIGETEKPDSDVLGKHGPKGFGTISIFEPDYYYRSSANGIQNEGRFSILLMIACYFVLY